MFDNFFIRIILRFLPDLPVWNDAEDVREFALGFLGIAAKLAKGTATEVDDKIVAALTKFADSQELWALFYGLIIDIVTGEEAAEGNPRVARLADEAGIGPATIIAIITAVVEFIKWWRNR